VILPRRAGTAVERRVIALLLTREAEPAKRFALGEKPPAFRSNMQILKASLNGQIVSESLSNDPAIAGCGNLNQSAYDTLELPQEFFGP
jgi:hypothetical protein